MTEEEKIKLDTNLKAYDLYLQRIMLENNLIWSRFKIYLSINVGAFAAVSLLFKEYIKNLLSFPYWLWILVFVISIVGYFLSTYWKSVNKDGIRWQQLMNEHLKKIEDEIPNESINLYNSIINASKSSTVKDQEDVVDTNVKVANLFLILWLFVGFSSLIMAIVMLLQEI